jgi:hypothetical protein
MNNIKKLLISAAVATVASVPVAQAATDSAGFNVTVILTATCEISAAPTDVAFTYQSFQPGVANSTGGDFSVRCTNTLPYTLSLDSTTGTVIGLNYSLSLSAAGGTGDGAAQAYSISGTMVSGQSGTCNAANLGTCSGSQARILTITY